MQRRCGPDWGRAHDHESAARRLIGQGGDYVNNERRDDPSAVVGEEDLGARTLLVLRAGKKANHIVRVV